MDFYVSELSERVPSRWWAAIADRQPDQLACLLKSTVREVWPLSLLAFVASTRSLSLARQPVTSHAKLLSQLRPGRQGGMAATSMATAPPTDTPVTTPIITATPTATPVTTPITTLIITTTSTATPVTTPIITAASVAAATPVTMVTATPITTSTSLATPTTAAMCTMKSMTMPGGGESPDRRRDGYDTRRGRRRSRKDNVSQHMALPHGYRRHVKPKKQHEILTMAPLLHQLCQVCDCERVVDVGAGQGHLSRLLSFGYNLKVTTVEAVSSHMNRANKFDSELKNDLRKEIFHQRKRRLELEPNSVDNCEQAEQRHSPEHIVATLQKDDCSEDWLQNVSSLNSHASGTGDQRRDESNSGRQVAPSGRRFVVTGLHACGDLSATMLRVFGASRDAAAIACVSCCYMKLTTSSTTTEDGYPMSTFTKQMKGHDLSYEAREAACHANDAYAARLSKNSPDLVLHSYRAALQEIILEKDPNMVRGCIKLTMKNAHRMSFQQYAEKALARLGVDPTLTCDQLARAEGRTARWGEVVAFFTLRLAIAPVIETQILLDRVLFLAERGISSMLLPIFRPDISPRNFILLAAKPDRQ